ncbi:MAG: hypothetical protein H0V43_07385 [Gemmatimonadales bacterium]|nr:hypothetical protein [Gemmatimonadales bacterium]
MRSNEKTAWLSPGRGNERMPITKNAIHCSHDPEERVAFDMDWFRDYLDKNPGGVTTFLILAHEWGHAVQDTWLESGGDDRWVPKYRRELNADCLAGVFLARSLATKQLV